jgi:hypothetical protein
MGLHETKRLLHHNRNDYQIEEAAPQNGGKTEHYTSDKGLTTRKYKELKKLNSPKLNDSTKKQVNELNRLFSRE